MTDIADRLVLAAETAIDGHHRAHLGEAADAAAAVLFELSYVHWVSPDAAAAMNALASEIKGDEADPHHTQDPDEYHDRCVDMEVLDG